MGELQVHYTGMSLKLPQPNLCFISQIVKQFGFRPVCFNIVGAELQSHSMSLSFVLHPQAQKCIPIVSALPASLLDFYFNLSEENSQKLIAHLKDKVYYISGNITNWYKWKHGWFYVETFHVTKPDIYPGYRFIFTFYIYNMSILVCLIVWHSLHNPPAPCAPPMPLMPCTPTPRHVSPPVLFACAVVLQGGLSTPAHTD